MFENFKALVKKLFGSAPQDTSGSVERAEMEYHRIDELNFDAIFGAKLANIAFSDSTMDVSDENGNTDGMRLQIVDDALEWTFSRARKIVTQVCSTGGRVLVPYVHGRHVHVDIIAQERLYIIDSDGDKITSAAILADIVTVNDKRYYRWVGYTLEDGNLLVRNKVTAEGGQEMPFAVVPAWSGIEPEYAIANVDRMPFAFLRCPADNRQEHDGYGVPITYGSDALIREIKAHMKTIAREYKLTRPMLGLASEMWRNRGNGSDIDRVRQTVQDGDDPFIPVSDYIDAGSPPWMIYAPAIRDGAMYNRLDRLFELLEKAVGTSKGILTARDSAAATATEIRAANHDTYTMINALRTMWANAMDDLAYAVDMLAENAGLSPAGGRQQWQIDFDWDWSLFESSSETWQQMLDAQERGVISKAEMRVWLRGESLEEAQEAIDEINDSGEGNSALDDILGGMDRMEAGQGGDE